MDFKSGSLDAFKTGAAQLLSKLTETIDAETTTFILKLAFLAVDIDTEKLEELVRIVYSYNSTSDEVYTMLITKLMEAAPLYLRTTIIENSLSYTLEGTALVRHYLITECQRDFDDTVTKSVWSRKPIAVMRVLSQEAHDTVALIAEQVLNDMVASDHLFVRENFKLLMETVLWWGQSIDGGVCKDEILTDIINKVSAKVPTGEIEFKVMVAGLIATRDNGWVMEIEAAPRILTPVTESEYELETDPQEDMHPPSMPGRDLPRVPPSVSLNPMAGTFRPYQYQNTLSVRRSPPRYEAGLSSNAPSYRYGLLPSSTYPGHPHPPASSTLTLTSIRDQQSDYGSSASVLAQQTQARNSNGGPNSMPLLEGYMDLQWPSPLAITEYLRANMPPDYRPGLY